MKLLLDTHALLWYTLNDPHLSPAAGDAIQDTSHDVYLSAASLWEIAIKVGLGRLSLQSPYDKFVETCLQKYGFRWLPLEPRHFICVSSLPQHHGDPFDRALIAQALTEGMSLVSVDAALDAYGVSRIW